MFEVNVALNLQTWSETWDETRVKWKKMYSLCRHRRTDLRHLFIFFFHFISVLQFVLIM